MKKTFVSPILLAFLISISLFNAPITQVNAAHEDIIPVTQADISAAESNCPQNELPFRDVPASSPNSHAICVLKELGILEGYGAANVPLEQRNFLPNQGINRAEALKVVLLSLIEKIRTVETSTLPWTDIDRNAWYILYLQMARANNTVAGFPNNTFRPGIQITRDQMAKIVIRAYFGSSADEVLNTFARQELVPRIYSDTRQDQWYSPYIRFVRRYNLLNPTNNNNFGPARVITRAETAEMIYRLHSSTVAPKRNQVYIVNIDYQPSTLTVTRGSQVTWRNVNVLEHTITSDTDLFDETLNTNETFSYTFNNTGTFNYHCRLHPEMTGRIIVTE